jgi:hypothetical protein
MQSVPITLKVVSLNPAHDVVYSIQHYVIKFVSDLRQVSGFIQVLPFPPSIKLAPRYIPITYIVWWYKTLYQVESVV